MTNLPSDRAIFLYMEPTNMRKSFHGLCKLVYQHDGRPDDGGYYVFVNRPQTHVKIIFWDGDRMVIYYKRLTQGAFSMPKLQGDKVCHDRCQQTLLLEGVVPLKTKRRFSRK